MLTTIAQPITEKNLQQSVQHGFELANGKWSPLVKGLDPYRKMLTALIMESTRNFIDNLDETTRITSIGAYDKYNFPMIRAVVPNLIATEIATVQPLNGPAALIFFMEFLYGTSKGAITAGTKMFDVLTGPDATVDYTSEKVSKENVLKTDGTAFWPTTAAAGTYSGYLNKKWRPIRPGTMKIFEVLTTGAGAITKVQIAHDNGSGKLIADTAMSAGTVDVTSSSVHYSAVEDANNPNVKIVTLTSSPDSNADPASTLEVDYEFISEAMVGDNIPDVDILLTSAPVTVKSRKMKARWSLEAANNMRSQYGALADVEVTAAMAEKVKFEIDREVINTIHSIAPAAHVEEFDRVSASSNPNISYTEHKLRMYDTLAMLSGKILKTTKRVRPNFIVGDIESCNIYRTMPGFKAYPAASTVGAQKIGVLNNQYVVFEDPFLTPSLANGDTLAGGGGLAAGVSIVGYKGASFLEAGFAYCPYVPLLLTPIVTLDDFVGRIGVLTQYATKVINPNMYGKVLLKSAVPVA